MRPRISSLDAKKGSAPPSSAVGMAASAVVRPWSLNASAWRSGPRPPPSARPVVGPRAPPAGTAGALASAPCAATAGWGAG
eukprot:4839801-Lingulodinium_polyedra.AAC.1